MQRIFFYGLFMDKELLMEKGFHPHVIGEALLSGYRIHISEKAFLIPGEQGRVYGIVMDLSDEETQKLYSDPGVKEYHPERVQVQLTDQNEYSEVVCYNLKNHPVTEVTNTEYASKLALLAMKLQFKKEYIDEIASYSKV